MSFCSNGAGHIRPVAKIFVACDDEGWAGRWQESGWNNFIDARLPSTLIDRMIDLVVIGQHPSRAPDPSNQGCLWRNGAVNQRSRCGLNRGRGARAARACSPRGPRIARCAGIGAADAVNAGSPSRYPPDVDAVLGEPARDHSAQRKAEQDRRWAFRNGPR